MKAKAATDRTQNAWCSQGHRAVNPEAAVGKSVDNGDASGCCKLAEPPIVSGESCLQDLGSENQRSYQPSFVLAGYCNHMGFSDMISRLVPSHLSAVVFESREAIAA